MADLIETTAAVDAGGNWSAGIYQLEQADLVLGGADGIDNVQAKQLLARVNYLKSELVGLGVSAFIRTLLDDPNDTAARATIGAVSQADIDTAIANLVASSPAALDTLNELATALGNDPNFAATITNALALKAPLESPAFTGVPTGSTAAPGTSTTQLATTEFVMRSGQTPAGAVEYFAMPIAPSGWLKANGAAVSRTTYADLFAAIGTTFGAGDGVNTFGLPDLRGEFLRGHDDGRGVDSGRIFGGAQLAFAGSITVSTATASITAGSIPVMDSITINGSTWNDNTAAQVVNVTPGDACPRNVAMLACIKY